MESRRWTPAARRAAAALADDWLATAVEDAPPPSGGLGTLERAEGCAGPHQLPIAILGGEAAGATLIVLRLTDFAAWFAPDGMSVACLRPGRMAPRGAS